jgi:hypothetical protein
LVEGATLLLEDPYIERAVRRCHVCHSHAAANSCGFVLMNRRRGSGRFRQENCAVRWNQASLRVHPQRRTPQR